MSSIAYGVKVECDLSLDDLPQSFEEPEIYIRVHRTQLLPPACGLLLSTFQAQARTEQLFVEDSHIVILIEDLFLFQLCLQTRKIQCYCTENVSEGLIRYWILQQMLPMFLLLRGTVDFLHGTATSAHQTCDVLGQRADHASGISDCIAFLGPSYAGKSTLLAHFLSRGHSLVTDDHLALSGDQPNQVLPAIPYYRPYRSIEDLGVVSKNYSPEAASLKRLYLLKPVPADAPIEMKRLTGAEAIASLMVDNHYSLHDFRAPQFLPLVEQRFRRLAYLARQIPVLRLHVPRSLERLSEVYDSIQLDLVSERYDPV